MIDALVDLCSDTQKANYIHAAARERRSARGLMRLLLEQRGDKTVIAVTEERHGHHKSSQLAQHRCLHQEEVVKTVAASVDSAKTMQYLYGPTNIDGELIS